ncbi:MAG: RluA family pseudouridine synthase [Granulosicoccus sp.]
MVDHPIKSNNQSGDDALKLSKSRHECVSDEQEGQRVDNFVIRHCPGVPRSHIYQLIRKGAILVNGKRIKQTRKLIAGEQVRIPALQVKTGDTVTVPTKLADLLGASVLLEHDDFLVVNKPAGVAVHGGSGLNFGLIDALRQHRDEKTLELSHRLDRATSGCLLIGRGLKANRRLQDLFRYRTIEKRYLALVAGHWPAHVRRIDAPLLKNVEHAGERRVMVNPDGQESLTHVSIARRYSDATLLDVTLDTGRTHQIRVHTKHIGHAVVGDDRYGDNRLNSRFRKQGLSRLYLHSKSLGFDWQGERVDVAAPTGSQWDESLKSLVSRSA